MPPFTRPHSGELQRPTATDFGLAYSAIEDRQGLEREYRAALSRGGATLLEVRSSLASNREHHRRIEAAVRAELEA